jgi:hypothetical protein
MAMGNGGPGTKGQGPGTGRSLLAGDTWNERGRNLLAGELVGFVIPGPFAP